MAFITKEEVKEVRENLKKAFPKKDGWKFSICGGNTSSLDVTIVEFPDNLNFPEDDYVLVNHYWLHEHWEKPEADVLTKIKDICLEKHWDESRAEIDYFNCAFYFHLQIGEWNKPAKAVHVQTKEQVKAEKEAESIQEWIEKSNQEDQKKEDEKKIRVLQEAFSNLNITELNFLADSPNTDWKVKEAARNVIDEKYVWNQASNN